MGPLIGSLALAGWVFLVVWALGRWAGSDEAQLVALMVSGMTGLFGFVTFYRRHEAMMFDARPERDEGDEVSKMREVLNLRITNGNNTRYVKEVPIDSFMFSEMARAMLSGDNFAWDRWVGTEPGRGWTRQQYTATREALIKLGVLEWVSPANRMNGLKLTRVGRAWLEHALASPALPSDVAEIVLK